VKASSDQPGPRPVIPDDGRTPWRLLALLMTMTAISSMSLNLLVPAVPRLAVVMQTHPDVIQLTVSLYVFGLALAQLITGPLSDRFGRRPVIIGGFALATLASLAAIAMWSAAGLIIMRLLQALGAATGVAIGRAIIRDLFGRERAAQMIGLVASAMAIAPMVAPLIGGILDTLFGWQAIFLFAAAASFLVLVWAAMMLPETRPRQAPGAEGGFRANVGIVLSSPRFLGYTLSAAFGSANFFVFVGAGPHVVITMMKHSSAEYGLWFLPFAGGFVVGNMITSRLSMRYGVDRMLWWGNVIEVVSAVLGVALVPFVDTLGLVAIILPSSLIAIGNGILLPNAIAGAVSIRPQAAGTASGVLGCTQMLLGAAMAQLAGILVADASTPMPMALQMLAVAAGCLAAFLLLRSPRAPRKA